MSTSKRTIFTNKEGTEGIVRIRSDGALDFGDEAYIDGNDQTADQLAQLVKKVRLGDQREIPKEEGDNSGTTILRDLQFEYKDGSLTVMIPVAHTVIEYRANTGNEKSRGAGRGKYTTIYSVKSMSIGIPVPVYNLIMTKLTSGYKGFTYDKTGEKVLNDYVWIDGSVSSAIPDKHATEAFVEANESQVTYVMIDGKEPKQVSIGCFRDVLKALECNLIGVAFINFRVKTVIKQAHGAKFFRLGATIDSFQVTNVTHIKSPDINVKKATNVHNKKYVIQDELMDILRQHNDEQELGGNENLDFGDTEAEATTVAEADDDADNDAEEL
ncbi:UNVERIFIED_CONTAM: hypothetical protein HDU68_009418 [Siphonaria sp. JEL0065]|nr:hypothetical protein HDU68_009418 [Siphonaria sp. JEL0065]